MYWVYTWLISKHVFGTSGSCLQIWFLGTRKKSIAKQQNKKLATVPPWEGLADPKMRLEMHCPSHALDWWQRKQITGAGGWLPAAGLWVDKGHGLGLFSSSSRPESVWLSRLLLLDAAAEERTVEMTVSSVVNLTSYLYSCVRCIYVC